MVKKDNRYKDIALYHQAEELNGIIVCLKCGSNTFMNLECQGRGLIFGTCAKCGEKQNITN